MNNKDSTFVSVVMAVHNEEKYLKESVCSILKQSFSSFEIIIIDDSSTDASGRIISTYENQDFRIKKIVNEVVLGLAESLNKGLLICRGKYVARIDADDIALPGRLEKQIEFLEKHPEVGALGAFYKEVDENGSEMPRKQNPVQWKEIRKALFFYNPIAHPTVMMRRDVLEKVGFYDESFPTSQDYELFSRIARVSELRNLDDVLLIRRFPRKVSAKKMRRQTFDCMRVQLRMLKSGDYPGYYILFMIKNLLALITPVWIRESIRRLRHRKYIKNGN